jgi:rod shape-determining protein MreC
MSTNRDDFGIAIRSALLQKGARQKFSLFFLICISIGIFFLDNYSSKFMDRTRSILNDSIYRVSTLATSPVSFISYLNSGLKKHIFTLNENKVLREKLAELQNKQFKNEFLITENKNLKEVLKSESVENYLTIIAKIILDKDSPYLKSLIINKGTRSNIMKGMPVIERGHLVGRIVEVNYLSARILLLNDLNSRIPVIVQPSGTQAILIGQGTSKPKLMYLPELYKIEKDSTVYTSGKDGVLSSGIPVGNINKNEELIEVKLFSDPNQLSFVNVILKSLKKKKEL